MRLPQSRRLRPSINRGGRDHCSQAYGWTSVTEYFFRIVSWGRGGALRVLILGGTSLTGPFLVRRLHGMRHEVTVVNRGQHETELPQGVRRIRADWRLLPGPPDPPPDVVIHMWAATEAH